jgi:nitrogen fixation protein FixH
VPSSARALARGATTANTPTAADAEEITATLERPAAEAEPEPVGLASSEHQHVIPASDLQPIPAAVDVELDDEDGAAESN